MYAEIEKEQGISGEDVERLVSLCAEVHRNIQDFLPFFSWIYYHLFVESTLAHIFIIKLEK